jgi:hypothetical protein
MYFVLCYPPPEQNPDPRPRRLPYLFCVAPKLAELNALFQLDPPALSEVLDIAHPVVNVLEQRLSPRLRVVLAVGHDGEARVVEDGEQLLAALGDLERGRLDVADVLAEVAQLKFGLFEVARDLRVLKLLGPQLVLGG